MATVTHKFVSPLADGANEDQVQPSNWNDTHNVTINWGDLEGTLSDQTDLQNALDEVLEAVPVFATRAALASHTYTTPPAQVRLSAYDEVDLLTGAAGGGTYARVDVEPLHSAKVQTLDGTWYELQTLTPNPYHFGAVGDGVADDSDALEAALNYGSSLDLLFGTYRITRKVTCGLAGIRIYGHGIASVGANRRRTAAIYVDNATLDVALHFTNSNASLYGFRMYGASAALGVLFEKPAGSSSDIDASVVNLSIEGITEGVKVVGRGLTVKDCSFGNLTTGVILDWPGDWTPNGQSNDLQETGARKYFIQNNLFHGVTTWVTNEGSNAQNIRSVYMSGNMGDIGGCPFRGALVESRLEAIVNIGATSATLIHLQPGSRNSTVVCRVGGIDEGSAERLPNSCLNIEASTDNEVRDITIMGSLGPCARNAVQIYGSGQVLGLRLIGVSIDRAGLDTGGSPPYCPISIFNSGGTLTKVELAMIGCSIDLTGSNSDYVVGGTNSANFELLWLGNQVRGATIPIAQSNVRVFQGDSFDNPDLILHSHKDGSWATDGTEWFARLAGYTSDVSGGGVGIAGSIALIPTSGIGSSAVWRIFGSTTNNRNVPAVDIGVGGVVPVDSGAPSLGTTTKQWLTAFLHRLTITDGVAEPETIAGHAQIFVDTADGDLKVKFGDGTVKTIVVDS